MTDLRKEHEDFENEVRRIARELFPEAQFSGATKVDGRERDGVFETEECFHLLEATTSRRQDKAENDIGKLVKLAASFKKHAGTKAVKCWFVTRDEPTPDQREAAEKCRDLVNVLSFAQFQQRLVNTRAYLEARDKCGFGSVRDPATGKGAPKVDYIQISLVDQSRRTSSSPADVVQALLAGGRAVILGDYGAGKSMTMRFLYRAMSQVHKEGRTSQFPVYLNLREHYGQTDPGEILQRHAVTIGFESPAHLVRAWRAGYVHLLLDGFDELTPLNIQGLWRKLQDNRYRAMELVRTLVRDHPARAGLALAGRAHFFDSDAERRRALGLGEGDRELSLTEFSDEQIREYFGKSGFAGSIPEWLPSRPLLVAYLASRGLLGEILTASAAAKGSLAPADGWDFLIEKISAREAAIEAGIDGPTIRRILERLATKARVNQGGLGPLRADALISAFNEVCGYAPDERGMVLLQRLPGLGIDRGEEETRFFIDEDFVDACRAGDLVEFVSNPYGSDAPYSAPMESGIGNLGLQIAATRCRQRGLEQGKIVAAVRRAETLASGHLIADLVRLSLELGHPIGETIYVKDLLIRELDLGSLSGNASQIEFQDCLFTRISIDGDVELKCLPRFVRCYVGILDGPVSDADLPHGVFEKCDIERFAADSETTDSVLSLDIPRGVRVLITVLKKLYERRGSGRRENALSRGLDHSHRRLVGDVLRLLQSAGMVSHFKRGTDTIWLPDRSNRARVGRIIASPTTADDPLIQSARVLG